MSMICFRWFVFAVSVMIGGLVIYRDVKKNAPKTPERKWVMGAAIASWAIGVGAIVYGLLCLKRG